MCVLLSFFSVPYNPNHRFGTFRYKIETITAEEKVQMKQYTNPVFDGGLRHSLRTSEDGGGGAGQDPEAVTAAAVADTEDTGHTVFAGFSARETITAKASMRTNNLKKQKRERKKSSTRSELTTATAGQESEDPELERPRKGSLDSPIVQLLDDMRSSYDPLEMVATFCGSSENAKVLQTLTPTQFASIVQAVPFQHAQASAASYVARSMAPTLLCSHLEAVLLGSIQRNPARIDIVQTLAEQCTDFDSQRRLIDDQLSDFEKAMWVIFG